MTQPSSPDIAALIDDLTALKRAANEFAAPLDDARFQRPPAEKSWSPSECLIHLSLTTRSMLPRIDAALKEGEPGRQRGARRYSRDLWGWLLCVTLEPPAKKWSKMATLATFVPSGPKPKADVLAEFNGLQNELVERVRRADGLDLNRLKVPSPFNEKLKYNVYSAFRIITAHQRRHLWQARQAVGAA